MKTLTVPKQFFRASHLDYSLFSISAIDTEIAVLLDYQQVQLLKNFLSVCVEFIKSEINFSITLELHDEYMKVEAEKDGLKIFIFDTQGFQFELNLGQIENLLDFMSEWIQKYQP